MHAEQLPGTRQAGDWLGSQGNNDTKHPCIHAHAGTRLRTGPHPSSRTHKHLTRTKSTDSSARTSKWKCILRRLVNTHALAHKHEFLRICTSRCSITPIHSITVKHVRALSHVSLGIAWPIRSWGAPGPRRWNWLQIKTKAKLFTNDSSWRKLTFERVLREKDIKRDTKPSYVTSLSVVGLIYLFFVR